MSTERWGHRNDDCPERWFGSFATRDEAIADGRDHHYGDEGFFISSGTQRSAEEFAPTADDIIELMREQACGEAGEAAEEFPDVSPEMRSELEKFLTAWASRLECRFWTGTGKVEAVDVPGPR
jgi:hypothetical protein